MDKIVTADDLESLLRNRFCPPSWAFIPQVRNGTGFLKVTGTIDALAMGLWPSRGLHLHGFEIKVSRGDWLKELNNPRKAENIAQFCDFWWVIAPKDLIKVEEVPQNWGLMIPFGDTTKVIKEAKQLKPIRIDKLFLAAILRRAQESIAPEAKIIAARKEGEEIGLEKYNQEFEYARKEFERLKQAVLDFEKVSGVKINEWCAEDIGKAVRMVLNGVHLRTKERLQALLETAKTISVDIEKQLIELEQKP